MMTDLEQSLGRRAYEAYGASVDWTTWDDRAMPAWHELGGRIQFAWITAAAEVMNGASEWLRESCGELQAADRLMVAR
jgi:hypothetical protein